MASLLSLETSGELLLLPPSPKGGEEGSSRKKEWWENAGNKIYTMAADKTISADDRVHKKSETAAQPARLPKEIKVEQKGEALGARGHKPPLLQRPST